MSYVREATEIVKFKAPEEASNSEPLSTADVILGSTFVYNFAGHDYYRRLSGGQHVFICSVYGGTGVDCRRIDILLKYQRQRVLDL